VVIVAAFETAASAWKKKIQADSEMQLGRREAFRL
jgi:hypothetical protein